MFSRLLPTILVGLAFVFALASCSKNNKKDAKAKAWKAEIPLSDTQASGCLSLPRLFSSLKSIDPDHPVEVVPTAISFDSQNVIRDDFRKLIAYGQLVIQHENMRDVQSVLEVTQDGCAKVTQVSSDGVSKDFTVKKSSSDSLMAEADDGERLDYTWLTPHSIQSRHRYAAFDQPCGTGDKPVLVSVTKVIDWGESVPDQVPASGSPYSIDSEFLNLASSAVGDSADAYYSGADDARVLDLGKVSEISSKPPRPEVVSCGGVAMPDPTPDPNNPPPSPTDPNNPDHPSNPDHPNNPDVPGNPDHPNNPDSNPGTPDSGPSHSSGFPSWFPLPGRS